ncbi:Tyrosine aminotransferase [Rhynchospora pubera]|uniref:Tyrosine aminotransferase n=1 Tax=Rhynchospora pubera TaxID=906938 RepID=A0AAV8DQP1_9POAL|nr:Tyrosine aminotransferase [Rhynchospora pubera]
MENGATKKPSSEATKRWHFGPNDLLSAAGGRSIRGIIYKIIDNVDEQGPRPMVPLGHGDPSVFPSFRITTSAEDAIVESLRSAEHNHYPPSVGLLSARRAIAEHLSEKLPYELSPDDVFITAGCNQSIELVATSLARPGANILLPRPGYPMYETHCVFSNLEFRHFDLIPERGWEIDLDQVEQSCDENTVAMVIINPGNPCGSVLSYKHMEKIAETASKLGIMVIADEVYNHSNFGSKPFVPMGVFGHIVPILTLGSLSKGWIVPGWRLGWVVITDRKGILKETKVIDSITNFLEISADPATFIQAAVPQIIERTKGAFFERIVNLLRATAEICYDKIKEISGITCPNKPEASMFVMVKLELSLLDGIIDDVDFCMKLSKEESVILCPGSALEMKNWLRITFAVEPSALELGLERLKVFCKRHEKKQSK